KRPVAVGGQAVGQAEVQVADTADVGQDADRVAFEFDGGGLRVASVRDDEVRFVVAVEVGGLDIGREYAAGIVDVGGRETTGPGPFEHVQVAVRIRLAKVRWNTRRDGSDVHDPVAVEVGDGQRRRNERDVRGERRDRGGGVS